MGPFVRNTTIAVTLLCGAACSGAMKLTPSDADMVLSRQLLDAPNPGHSGDHGVQSLYYGSGTDRRRPEFRDSVAFTTDSVDA